MLVVLLSIVGVVLNAWYLRESEIGPIAWSMLPYILTGGLSLTLKSKPWPSIFLGAVALMLLIDGWLVLETVAGTKSSFLLAVSLMSTLKLFTALPIGALFGYLLYRIFRS